MVTHIVLSPGMFGFGTLASFRYFEHLEAALAARFAAEGWSVKELVRELVLTRVYHLSADATPAHLAADPANRLLWRHAPRRLTAEEVRDAALAAAGTLDRSPASGSPESRVPLLFRSR